MINNYYDTSYIIALFACIHTEKYGKRPKPMELRLHV